MRVTSTDPDPNGTVEASGCELKNDVTIDLPQNNAVGFADGINWTTGVVENVVVPFVSSSLIESSSNLAPWIQCTTSSQCTDKCLAASTRTTAYSSAPLWVGSRLKTWEGCVGSPTRLLRAGNEDLHTADETTFVDF